MTTNPKSVIGFGGVDNTLDPYLLGKMDPTKSALAYNYRLKNGIRVSRHGYEPVINFASASYAKKSGVHFPVGSKAIFPHAKVNYDNSFFMASSTYVAQKAFTFEFQYRCDYVPYDRVLFNIPVDFTADSATFVTSLKVVLHPIPSGATHYPKKTYLQIFALVGDGGAPETKNLVQWISLGALVAFMPTDGEWVHVSVRRAQDASQLKLMFNGDVSTISNMLNPTPGAADSNPFLLSSTFAEDQDSPIKYNHFEMGADDVDLAEVRMWNFYRSDEQILEDYNTELTGTETGLLFYAPLNEGTGKYFLDKVSGGRGYFHPQEPWVDDDDRLIFTGYECRAYPSLRAKWTYAGNQTGNAYSTERGCGLRWRDSVGHHPSP